MRALNFVFEDTVEYRVREVLEEKLTLILKEFGVDKTGDVLDSAQAGKIFDDLYIETLLNPENLNAKVASVVSRVQEQVQAVRESVAVYETNDKLNPAQAQQMIDHPIPHWVERMTVTYLEAHGGIAKKTGRLWDLTWPTGEHLKNIIFTAKDATADPSGHYLTLEDARIRGLTTRLPRFAEEQPIPCITLTGLPVDVQGFWSLWRIAIYTADWNQQRMMPLFLHDNGRAFLPTARHIWDQLLACEVEVGHHLLGDVAMQTFEKVWASAAVQGKIIYDELVQKHRQQLAREREKGEYAFAARRSAIERIGLPQVRDHRLAQLAQEEQAWREQLNQTASVSPELVPLLLVRIEGGGGHG